MRKTGRPRGPGIIYSAASLVIFVLIGVIALSSAQPPPPTIAEFAPQAAEVIQEAPGEQATDLGAGAASAERGEEAGDQDPTLGERPPPIDVARVRRCVGDPPRQIEDPQSPPCVPYWEGDNGGETSKGVTANEIRIAVPLWHEITGPLETFFNSRFELYGRRIRFIETGASIFGAEDPAAERADAVEADSQNVFASLAYPSGSVYHEELADREVVSAQDIPTFTENQLARFSPHIWQYPKSLDGIFANLGEWICGRLAGRNATNTTDPRISTEQRAFGLTFDALAFSAYEGDIGIDELERELERCGESLRLPPFRHNRQVGDVQNDTNEMLQMSEAGVTSIICMCEARGYGSRSRAATSQGYYPEWILTDYYNNHSNRDLHLFGQKEQLAHTFGLAFEPRQIRPENEPARWAVNEVDPAYDDNRGNSQSVKSNTRHYRHVLLIASGLQMAGPELTPEAFRRGLVRAAFPNPAHPNMPGAVGFNGGGHSMMQDGVEWWWSNTGQSPYPSDPRGSICYVDGGARYAKGSWPEGEGAFFTEPCDSGA